MLSSLRRCATRTLCRNASSLIATRSVVPRNAITSATATTTTTTSFNTTQALSASRLGALRSLHTTSTLREARRAEAAEEESQDGDDEGKLVTTFAELGSRKMVHPTIVNTITRKMKLENMTDVQTQTINNALRGKDILAQAKTGTGKTLGFLIPVLQNMVRADPSLAERATTIGRGRYARSSSRTTADDIRALIVSPTRELAEQIAAEARRLVEGTGVIVQTAVGGTRKNEALRQMQREGSHILVGTPGRLKDIFSDPRSGVSAPGLDVLVFDEADRLLDQGFWAEIQDLMELLPRASEKDRQTLMFSATVPREVITLVKATLKKDFDFVKTVRDDEEPTHARVPQKLVEVRGFENYLPALVELCSREIKASSAGPEARPFKAIVYFNSTVQVSMAASTLHNLPMPEAGEAGEAGEAEEEEPESRFGRFGASRSRAAAHPLSPARIFEIHAKLSQSQRTRAADSFRACKSGILLSSDVTARGMDFPNVTHVIQIGLPSGRDTYIHRLGRTARAGKEGQGWLIVSEVETREMHRRLHSLPLVADRTLSTAAVDMTREGQVPADAVRVLGQVAAAIRLVPIDEKFKVYTGMLGVYGWMHRKDDLIEAMNNLTRFGFGLREPPRINRALAQRLGITRIPGVNLGESRDRDRDDDRGDRGAFAVGGALGRSMRRGRPLPGEHDDWVSGRGARGDGRGQEYADRAKARNASGRGGTSRNRDDRDGRRRFDF